MASEVIGTVDGKRFSNDENGFAVVDITDEETNAPFVAVGTLATLESGERVRFTGDWVFHKTYGKQLKVYSFETKEPSTDKAIENYLSSGAVKGIGLSMARMIVKKFGTDTFNVIEKDPKRLLEIPGIGKTKMAMITSSYMQNRETRDTMMALQQFDMSTNQAMKIYKLYGANCVQLIKQNPYRLIDEVENIGFKTADKIAHGAGIAHDSEFRVRAGIRYMLEWARQEGHTFLAKDVLINATVSTLDMPEDAVISALHAMIMESKLVSYPVGDVQGVFLPAMRFYESDSAKRLLMLNAAKISPPIFNISEEITVLESEYGITLAPKQREAVVSMITNGAVVITGGPGTGKTTILKIAIGIMDKWGIEYELAAPTGRAAKRMTAATGKTAKTIHRLLEYSFSEQCFMRDDDSPLETDVVIIDEMSMVDCMLMHALLRAIAKGTRIIMVGDADQLPSVGAGNVLSDIIRSRTVPAIRLNEIYRQSGRSMIVTNAHRINNGQFPVFDNDELDFAFEETDDVAKIMRRVLTLNTSVNNTPLFTRDPAKDVQVLAPIKRGALGVYNLNREMQQAMNPPCPEKQELTFGDKIFREGDKVMQIKNDYTLEWTRVNNEGNISEQGMGVFNGDIGTVSNADVRNETLTILFDDGCIAEYDHVRLEELELAYCISIHKSQGSEFPIVMIPLCGGAPMFLTRNLLYTAVTRAKNQVYIVGRRQDIEHMVNNNKTRGRNSSLCQLLTEYDNMI